jgi:hypothetical protein
MQDRYSFNSFLNKLLCFESGIDPKKFDWYIENMDNPIIEYPKVIKPGKIKRDHKTGNFCMAKLTVKEYFESLGIFHLFNPYDRNCIKIMQYNTINPLGFVGYQLGESILISTEYYIPPEKAIDNNGQKNFYKKYYFGEIDKQFWKNSTTEVLYTFPETNNTILATDVNYWEGDFIGKDGIYSFFDLVLPDKQEKVIREVMKFNYTFLKNLFYSENIKLENTIKQYNKTFYKNDQKISLSGVLAAAYLVGAVATLIFFKEGIVAKDEFNTSIEKYLLEYSNYKIDFI